MPLLTHQAFTKMVKNRENYEIINPADVGVSESLIVLTARSGRAALRYRLQKLDFQMDKYDIEDLYAKFIEIADREKEVKEEHLLEMMERMGVPMAA
jgi:2-isopropylmalate synthase